MSDLGFEEEEITQAMLALGIAPHGSSLFSCFARDPPTKLSPQNLAAHGKRVRGRSCLSRWTLMVTGTSPQKRCAVQGATPDSCREAQPREEPLTVGQSY